MIEMSTCWLSWTSEACGVEVRSKIRRKDALECALRRMAPRYQPMRPGSILRAQVKCGGTTGTPAPSALGRSLEERQNMSNLPQWDLPLMSSELPNHVGESVTVAGWVHTQRQLGGMDFLLLRDGQGVIQVVIHERRARFSPETVLAVTGVLLREPRAPQGIEIHHPQIRVLAEVNAPLPFSMSGPSESLTLPMRLDYAPLALRRPETRRWFRVTDHLLQRFRAALNQRHFVEIHTPKIVSHASEGGANVFELNYFGRRAYLAQSPQFYKQAMVGVFGRVFEVGPVFRAEPHDTARHLNQYTSLDVEVGFIDDHSTVIELCRQVLAEMLLDPPSPGGERWPMMPPRPPVIHFSLAMELVSNALGQDFRQEPDLAPSHERWLGQWAQREFGSDFLFVEGYPMRKRPFYTYPDPERPEFSRSFDLLFRGQELVTGGQRLHRYQDYLATIAAHHWDVEDFASYLMAFRYGMPPHGGFAIGLERLVAQLAGFSNLRQAALFPRDWHRLNP